MTAAEPATTTTGRRSVWARRPRPLWPVALTVTLLGSGFVGLAFSPRLAAHAPLLLLALRPTPSIIILVGGRVPFAPALIIGTVLRGALDLGYFGLARHTLRGLLVPRGFGAALVATLSKRGTERALLWFCLLNTNLAVDAALGSGAVSTRRFSRFLFAGSTISTVLYLLLGRAVAGPARAVVTWADSRAGVLIAGTLALAAGPGLWARRRARRRRRAAGPADTDAPAATAITGRPVTGTLPADAPAAAAP